MLLGIGRGQYERGHVEALRTSSHALRDTAGEPAGTPALELPPPHAGAPLPVPRVPRVVPQSQEKCFMPSSTMSWSAWHRRAQPSHSPRGSPVDFKHVVQEKT